jgi:hypothetical protein
MPFGMGATTPLDVYSVFSIVLQSVAPPREQPAQSLGWCCSETEHGHAVPSFSRLVPDALVCGRSIRLRHLCNGCEPQMGGSNTTRNPSRDRCLAYVAVCGSPSAQMEVRSRWLAAPEGAVRFCNPTSTVGSRLYAASAQQMIDISMPRARPRRAVFPCSRLLSAPATYHLTFRKLSKNTCSSSPMLSARSSLS